MKFIALAFIVLLLIAIAYCVIYLATGGAKAIRVWSKRKEPWVRKELSAGDCIMVYAFKPANQPINIGKVNFDDDDFDMQLYELRAEANEKIMALNNQNKLGS